MNRHNVLFGAAAVVVGLLSTNALFDRTLGWARADWTADHLYTLDEGTRELVSGLSEPVRLQLYWSDTSAKELPAYRAHAQRVREFLEELVLASDGKLSLEVLDPEPFSEAEDQATAAGLAALPIDGTGAALTLGLVAHNSVDESESIPFLDPSDEALLEYEVARLIYALDRTSPTKVALITSLPLEGGPADPMAALSGGPPPEPPWQVLTQLRKAAEVELVAPDAEALPEDAEVVVLAHPKGLSDGLLRAIDEFAFGGGDLIAFVDPHCEAVAGEPDPFSGSMPGPESSDLGPLLEAWGVEFDPSRVVGDRAQAQRVTVRNRRGGIEQTDMVTWPQLRGDSLAGDDPLVARLEAINVASAGSLRLRDGAKVKLEPILTTSDDAGTLPSATVAGFPDPRGFASALVSADGPLTIAARLSGQIGRAFAADDAGGDGAEDVDGASGEPETATAGGIVLVADADLLADRNWIQEQRFGQMLLGYARLADNGDFLLNAVEALGGDGVLLGLRGGGTGQRSFERVEDLRRDAEAKYQAREAELQGEIGEAQARINELQREKTGEDQMILSDAQAAELDRLQQEMLVARKELRAVRHGLQEDIDRLGQRLMLANVLGMPTLVALLTGLSLWRRGRRAARS
ncbi:Gldg family protein [Engelhardtia mirabilis]|uniref:ABC-type uncharacterized transport system n=1 Tax=Engelhardtia mirabilis TaxID=2528011 RepID=A0A518BMA0_9BACT|nr:ABC-type uncharacterized transport system [Planctomycetes bacterium Pla133]QDV02434.1 ABC-type uncharacterized transport system [Planctomycetes bacterium Pla86]